MVQEVMKVQDGLRYFRTFYFILKIAVLTLMWEINTGCSIDIPESPVGGARNFWGGEGNILQKSSKESGIFQLLSSIWSFSLKSKVKWEGHGTIVP